MSRSVDTDEYYRSALDPIFTALKLPSYVTVARWSYTPNADNPLLFAPGAVGNMDEKQIRCIDRVSNADEFNSVLRRFSFTRLLVENDLEMWFHFTNEDPPKAGERQVYVGYVDTGIKRTPILEVAAEGITPNLVNQIIQEFEHLERENPIRYNKVPLREKGDEVKQTLDVAIFSLFQNEGCKIKHVYFVPVSVPTGAKRVVGIISINSSARLRIGELEPILQPFAQGVMAPFHFQEIDDQRAMFSLRSAIAAIMSRNMSHNIGSHVLWHLSQELGGGKGEYG